MYMIAIKSTTVKIAVRV